jgi:sulfite reductase alpha subunit-like flavoprotein
MAMLLYVLYGSATGTGQDVAEQIGRMGIARNIQCQVLAMNDFPLESLPALRYAVFVASSTGDGEAPDNMSSFWKFLLRKSLPKGLLQDLQMAVFGLGDSSYAKYNAAARRLQVKPTSQKI